MNSRKLAILFYVAVFAVIAATTIYILAVIIVFFLLLWNIGFLQFI